jgi:hypothetical protein
MLQGGKAANGLVGALALVLVSATPALATPINGTPTGLVDPVLTITFDEHVLVPDVTLVTNQYADLGVIFSPDLIYTPETTESCACPGFPNISGNDLGNWTNAPTINFVNPFSIHFLVPRTAAAFAFAADETSYTFTALLGGTSVESFNATVELTSLSDFYGFTGITFDEIQVNGHPTTNLNALGGPYNLLDHLQVGPAAPTTVPESSTVTLTALGLASLVSRYRRRRAQEGWEKR